MPKTYDPRMHSAEHILNQTMVRMFKCGRSFSSHLERRKSKCDYHFYRDLRVEEIEELERRVNEIIQASAIVREEFMSRDDAARKFDLSRLPENTGPEVRIISIGDYDACPCVGEHVGTTREIGVFRIVSTTWENGVLRVRFRIGERSNSVP